MSNKMSKANAVGSVWKNKAGYWDAKVEVRDHDSNLCFSIWGEERMKDAINICNIYCKDLLKWKITIWEHRYNWVLQITNKKSTSGANK